MGRFLSKKKLVAGGVVLMSTVALVFTVLTLQGILALGSGQERTQDDAVGEEEKAIRTAAIGGFPSKTKALHRRRMPQANI